MSDIKLLPPPKWLSEGFTDQTIRLLAVYTQANMAPLIAEIDRLRAELENEKSKTEFYRITRNWNQRKARRLEEAEAEVSELREERETIAAEAVKYAETSGHLVAKIYLLTEALRDARVMVEDWASYASEYFQNKYDLAGDLAQLDEALRDQEEK